MIILNDLSVI